MRRRRSGGVSMDVWCGRRYMRVDVLGRLQRLLLLALALCPS